MYYAQGNLARAQGQISEARKLYDDALRILNDISPAHILVACTHYKIACVEHTMGNSADARRNLETAANLIEIHRRGVDDGNLARILWKRAEIDLSEPSAWELQQQRADAEAVRDEAEEMRIRIEKTSGIVTSVEDADEETYDRLVCGYFR